MSFKKTLNNVVFNKYTVPFTPFYKKHPFHGKSSIRSADDRGCIDYELGLFYNRVPKASNSTVVLNLVRLKLAEEISSKQAKGIFRKPSSLSIREVEKFETLFKFTFVRDPFSRILSAYLDKIDRCLNKNTEYSGEFISFKDFLNSLKNGKLYSNLHWAPQTSILLIPLEDFDFIGKFEKLNEDLAFVMSKVKGQTLIESDFSKEGPPSTKASDKIKKYYDAECVELIQKMYSKDFELLGYNNTIG